MNLLQQIVENFEDNGIAPDQTKILATSIRSVVQTATAFAGGADIVTVPWDVLRSICDNEWNYSKDTASEHPSSPVNLKHPVTEAGLLRFHLDFQKIPHK